MAVERSELELVWPADLFAAEARALLAGGADDDALAGLLTETFHGGRGEQLLQQIARAHAYQRQPDADPWALLPHSTAPDSSLLLRATGQLVADLAGNADELPRHVPRLLFGQRQRVVDPVLLTVAECKGRFAQLVVDLTGLGYFEDAFGSECSDSGDSPDVQGQRALAKRLELNDVALWPLQVSWNVFDGPIGVHQDWADEVFFSVVEALDEVVARPRQRRWHDYHDYHDGWDYDDYARPAGQAVYRWRVNDLLDQSAVPLRLARTGGDAGLLVHATGDHRDQLTDRALNTADVRDRAEVRHAVALFRGRAVSREEKRSAIFTLGRVLEERRPLVEATLTKKDAGALFQIANEFDLRHRRSASHGKAQRDDYDDAFLDWVYWWYLSTVELTNQLLEGRPSQP